jgi:hypothetical protein
LSKRKCQQNFDFTLNGGNLDVIDHYIYLGITFKYNGSFVDARKRLVEHAQKLLFSHSQKNQKSRYTNRFATEIV